MPRGMEVGLGPGDSVLDEDLGLLPQMAGCIKMALGMEELHPLRSLVTSVLGHFGPFFKDRNDRGPK